MYVGLYNTLYATYRSQLTSMSVMHAIKTLPSSNKSFSRKVTIGADVLRGDSDLVLVQNEGKEDN